MQTDTLALAERRAHRDLRFHCIPSLDNKIVLAYSSLPFGGEPCQIKLCGAIFP
jgi:hypothetical protein